MNVASKGPRLRSFVFVCSCLLQSLFASDVDPERARLHRVLELHSNALSALAPQELSVKEYVADRAAGLVVGIDNVGSNLDRLHVSFVIDVEGHV